MYIYILYICIYSQTFSNYHFYKGDHSSKTTNAESTQVNSLTIVTV